MEVDLNLAGPGFLLPDNIGDLDPAITELDLSSCNLAGRILFLSHTFCLSLSFSHTLVSVMIKAGSLRVYANLRTFRSFALVGIGL
jgi:hypothetical protein